MRVMGIDPGTISTGFGIIDFENRRFKPVFYGVIKTGSISRLSLRYLHIFNGLKEIIDTYKPDCVAVEGQFVFNNVASALKLGQAKGIVVLSSAKHDIPIYEYQPKDIKQSVTGRGVADKDQVAAMVKLVLGLKEVPRQRDITDALAIAICHCNNISNRVKISKRI
ncbi:MAG: crossover junction endodeoxyribonuclease RuvC [bacterium]|nr:crossover junction endodeoxyribonuclease RuvC [bacterium]